MPNRIATPKIAKLVTIVAVLVGLCFGIAGAIEKTGLTPASWPTLILSVLTLFVPNPELVANSCEPWAYRVGAFICGVSGFMAALVLWLHTINRTVTGLWTQVLRRDHILLYGQSPLLDGLAPLFDEAGHSAIRVQPAGHGMAPDPRVTVAGPAPADLAARVGLNRARTVVIDTGADAEVLSLAKPILAHLRARPTARVQQIAVRLADPVIADQFHEIVGRYGLGNRCRLLAFDENMIMARSALAADPLFGRAAARDQDRVHALIVGMGGLGERLLDQVMLTGLARDLKPPKVTVIDCDAERCQRALVTRRPALLDHLDIRFVSLDLGRDPLEGPQAPEALDTLRRIEAEVPFTAIFLALGAQADVMRAALLLDRARSRTGQFRAPIYYRCRLNAEAEDLLDGQSPPPAADHGFVRMSPEPGAVLQTILGNPVTEALARRLHEAYRKGAGVTPDADKPWEALPETYRRANIRAADHMPAKLWTVGIRMEGDPAKWRPTQADCAILRRLIAADDQSPELQALARLEHDRWMIDRYLDGWVQGPERDNARRIHTLLVPYEALAKAPEEQQKDIDQTKQMLGFVLAMAEER